MASKGFRISPCLRRETVVTYEHICRRVGEDRKLIILRDMLPSDIEDYVRWFSEKSEEIDWTDYDAPWEKEETTPEAERAVWTQYYASVRAMPPEAMRWRFEIEADGVHIGWVSAYCDLGYLDNSENLPAIGIDIPERRFRRRGNGEAALRTFIDYLKNAGYKALYTQTWSGNLPMVRLAEKLGFKEAARRTGLRQVRGKKYDAITWKISL